MRREVQNVLISASVLGAFVFLSPSVTPARGAASESEATLGGPQAPSSRAPHHAQASQASSKQTLTGTWKFNRGQSDDPTKKLVSDDNISTGDTGTTAPLPGQVGGRPDASQNGTSVGTPPPGVLGAPGGMGGVGGLGAGPMPLPQTAPSHRWETDKDREKRLEGLLPASSLTIEQKDNEVDLDDLGRKEILYTDGRKLRKSKDDRIQEFTARWDAGNLTYDEKRPPRGTITRTFELSLDGRQLIETMTIDNGSISVPVVLKYVYDAAQSSAQ